jgi:hypothetical protein
MDAVKKLRCACSGDCDKMFVPKTENQIYFDRLHANRAKARRLRQRAKLATKAGLVPRRQAIA